MCTWRWPRQQPGAGAAVSLLHLPQHDQLDYSKTYNETDNEAYNENNEIDTKTDTTIHEIHIMISMDRNTNHIIMC